MNSTTNFTDLGLNPSLLTTLNQLGYETATPIQQESIPILLQGNDIIAQAQTGTGKTAAFALPILTQLILTEKQPQALILTPTRELAIQVAEALQSYAKNLKGFHVLPIYGGQDYRQQLRALKRAVHVIVGTPGRINDHLRRGTLKFSNIKTVVLDEADEMLKMGFIDEVETILKSIPEQRQTALFSATMPTAVQKVAKKYLHDAVKVHIKAKTRTVANIEQAYIVAYREHKLEVLTRILDIEDINGVIIFSRTKTYSVDLADRLAARGYASAAINGDMKQSLREKTIKSLREGRLDIVVATDVAARGIDVERISHVINYDIPYDAETYIHRIGRTGRAGRSGKAIVLVTPKERYMLRDIERATSQPMHMMQVPTLEQISAKRLANFSKDIQTILQQRDLSNFKTVIKGVIKELDYSALEIAAALAYLQTKNDPIEIDQPDELIEQIQAIANRPKRGKKQPNKPNKKRARFKDKEKSFKRDKSKTKIKLKAKKSTNKPIKKKTKSKLNK
ncbi:MAG: DEAD/DEAH box helicase [Pseudomonadota bacterium]